MYPNKFLNSLHEMLNESSLSDTEKEQIHSLLDEISTKFEAYKSLNLELTKMHNTPEGEKIGRALIDKLYTFIKEVDTLYAEVKAKENQFPFTPDLKKELIDLVEGTKYMSLGTLRLIGFYFKKQNQEEVVSKIEEMSAHLPLSEEWGFKTPFLTFESEQEKQLTEFFDTLHLSPAEYSEFIKETEKVSEIESRD